MVMILRGEILNNAHQYSYNLLIVYTNYYQYFQNYFNSMNVIYWRYLNLSILVDLVGVVVLWCSVMLLLLLLL